MREAGLEMVLDAPEVAKAGLLRQRYLLQHLVEDFGLALAMLQGLLT
jgi:hypothetical protein